MDMLPVEMAYFDAHSIASISASIPVEMGGAILFGAQAGNAADYRQIAPSKIWCDSAPLSYIVSAADSRFPANSPALIDLQLPADELMQALRAPSTLWWPLMETLRTSRSLLRLSLPPGARAAIGVRRLAQKFPNVSVLIDPFVHGPSDGWQAQVRLAETDNIWLTTLGMLPNPGGLWARTDIDEAMYFLAGEVGAGKLLFASGCSADASSGANPQNWLAEIECLDEDQRQLILKTNAETLLGPR